MIILKLSHFHSYNSVKIVKEVFNSRHVVGVFDVKKLEDDVGDIFDWFTKSISQHTGRANDE